MKILVVSSYLPFPLFSGGHVRLYNILKKLSKNNEITLVCERRDYQKEQDILEVKKFCKEIFTVEKQKQWSLKNIIKSIFSLSSFLLVGHTSEAINEKITELLNKEKFDLIHVETFYVMQNLPNPPARGLPIVLVEHNIEYLVYSRFANSMPFFIRPFLYLDILKLKYWEKHFWQKATKLVAVSESEKKLMKRNDAVVVQNGVDKESFKMESAGWRTKFKAQKKILFIGDFKWLQNRDSVEWILKEIWPKVQLKIKEQKLDINLKLWIVGREIPDSIKKLSDDKNVAFDENAPKVTPEIFRQSDILLSPIRVGGGTSYKILEAMASGVPVITTSLGIEGIDAGHLKEVLIADNAEDIVDLIIDIVGNDSAFEKIAHNARKLVEEKYDWEPIVKKLEEVYKSALRK
ncbi:MAG: glycosyltransferase family 4 protein [Candidatus Levyibacteriota bacterium]